jgi:hypothetical protein
LTFIRTDIVGLEYFSGSTENRHFLFYWDQAADTNLASGMSVWVRVGLVPDAFFVCPVKDSILNQIGQQVIQTIKIAVSNLSNLVNYKVHISTR